MPYCVVFDLTSCGNYLVTLISGIKIKSKYFLTSNIRAFGSLIVGIFKLAKEKYIKMVILKGASDKHY